mgnify:CR=1 FL=1
MTEELRAQLMGVKLTKKEKLIADFILDNFAEACFITSTILPSSALPERWATAASWNFRGQSARHIPSG